MVISLATTAETARIAILAHGIVSPTVTGLQSMRRGFLLHNMRSSGSATEHAPIHVVSEHSGASQVATEHNVTDQSTSDVNDTESDDGPIRPCALCKTELLDDPPPHECRVCSRETCFDCMGRCYQPECQQRFCDHCLREHAKNCRGRGDFTFQLCWASGECIQRFQNIADLSIERLVQDMDEGLIQGLPRARTTPEGQWLEYYSLVYRTDVMSDGTWLSDYNLEHEARLTVVRVELSNEFETWRRS